MDIVGIITARGGSKGLVGKNILELDGKPLIAYTINAALEANLKAVYVTSDSRDILAIAEKFGAKAIHRPSALATDDASSQSAVRHALEHIGADNYSHLMLLQPTSPFRNAAHIREAIAHYQSSHAASLISVCEADHHPYKALTVKDGMLSALIDNRYLSTPRQSLPPAYVQNGAIYLLGISDFLAHDSFLVEPACGYVMDKQSSLDIDDAMDFKYAAYIKSIKND